MTHTSTFKIDEVDIGGVGTLSAPIEIDYSFRLEHESGEGRSWLAIMDFKVDEVRIGGVTIDVSTFLYMVGEKQMNKLDVMMLTEIQTIKVEM